MYTRNWHDDCDSHLMEGGAGMAKKVHVLNIASSCALLLIVLTVFSIFRSQWTEAIWMLSLFLFGFNVGTSTAALKSNPAKTGNEGAVHA